jgi:hypothetical protein
VTVMFGPSVAREPELFTCDCCDAMHLGDRTDLRSLGWVRHGGTAVAFLMCGPCNDYFEPVWARRRAQRETERRLTP